MYTLSIPETVELAIKLIEENKEIQPYIKKSAIKTLLSIKNKDAYKKWDKEKIINSLNDWKKKNGRTPTVSSLRENGMPCAATIQRYFDMKPAEFLNLLYPEDRWPFKTEDDWLQCFKEQFLKIEKEQGYVSSKIYDQYRDDDTPTFNTIIRNCKLNGWCDLMEKAGVKYSNNTISTSKSISIKIKSPFLEQYEKLNKEREKQMEELSKMVNNIPV